MRLVHPILAAAVLCIAAAGVQAQEEVPAVDARLSATFRDPVGTVLPTDSIEMWVTLRSVGTDAVTFDLGAAEPFGLPQGFSLPTEGFDRSVSGPPPLVPFDYYDRISRFFFRYNSNDSFVAGGLLGPYRYDLPNDGHGWLDQPTSFALAAGDSIDIHLYTLTPVGGAAAPGSYQAFNVGVGLTLYGYALDGETELSVDLFNAATCNGQVAGCAGFSRTVTAVPEPESVAMFIAGLVVLRGVFSRRRKSIHDKVGAG